MTKFNVGDLVVLKSGSMRMVVEDVATESGDETVRTVWCNEGVIGRDAFSAALLNKWEVREDSAPRGGAGRGKPHGGEREGGGKPYRGGGGGGDRDRDDRGGDRPPRKTGWDGKPREKKFYRKEG